jgi:hypothetical protein
MKESAGCNLYYFFNLFACVTFTDFYNTNLASVEQEVLFIYLVKNFGVLRFRS